MASHQPTSGTSKVIENLQTTIDSLKSELNETKATLSETKQKYAILSKRNESMVEQLSNVKHQAEVAESLLKRKERRVLDLESQITEVASSSDSYRFQCETLKNKMQNMESDKSRLQAENERLSKSYDILQSSFNDYKLSISHSVSSLKCQIPTFIDSTKNRLAENLSQLHSSQPQIDSSYNMMLKNSKRLEELYSQKYDKVNNYLILLAESTKQHGQSTSIIMEECEDILKKLNRNEDVLLKIKNETTGNLTDLDKMREFNKRRDFSILNDSSNIHNSQSAASSTISSPSLNSPSTSASPSFAAGTSTKAKNSLSSSLSNGAAKFSEKRRISPGILDSKFNPLNNTSRGSSPEVNENDSPRERSNNNNNTVNRDRKRHSLSNIPKKDQRRRSSYRQSMNLDDHASFNSDQHDDQSHIDRRKRVISSNSPGPYSPSSSNSSTLGRSNSTRRNNNRPNNRVSSTSSNPGNNNNHRRSWQPHDIND